MSMTIAYKVRSGLYVNLTNRCPCACDFCLRKNGPGVYGSKDLWLEREPSLEEVHEAVHAALDDSVKEVVFCGYGEPTERLSELCAIAHGLKVVRPDLPIRLNTNGLGDLIWGRSIVGDLKGVIDTVSISLNTDDPAEYERVCHPKFGPKSYQAMKAFAATCALHLPNVVMTIVDQPVTTPEQQERCRVIAEALGAKLRIRPYES